MQISICCFHLLTHLEDLSMASRDISATLVSTAAFTVSAAPSSTVGERSNRNRGNSFPFTAAMFLTTCLASLTLP